jgi:hypothetical protein
MTLQKRSTAQEKKAKSGMAKRKKPKLGTLRGLILVVDPNWWKPMTDEEVDKMFGTNYSDRRT